MNAFDNMNGKQKQLCPALWLRVSLMLGTVLVIGLTISLAAIASTSQDHRLSTQVRLMGPSAQAIKDQADKVHLMLLYPRTGPPAAVEVVAERRRSDWTRRTTRTR